MHGLAVFSPDRWYEIRDHPAQQAAHPAHRAQRGLARYGVPAGGATYLIRPDGHVLARCRGMDAAFAAQAIEAALHYRAAERRSEAAAPSTIHDRDRLYEEFEASLEYYDLALAVSPEYRDALLGKAISLAYLERHDESMRVLDRMIGLGFWLLGEAHYWLAWNLRELERFPEALGHIDESKSRLQTNPHVFGLAGAIGLAVGELGRAEQDLLESVKLDPADPEPFAGLGTVYSRQARWALAGEHFERAARAWDAQQAAVALAIEDLKAASVAPERKARLVRRRAAQLERARFESAANDYPAAAAFFNGGDSPRALEAARRAAGRPRAACAAPARCNR